MNSGDSREIASGLRWTPSGAEFVEEAEITESETQTGRERRNGLADIALAAMHRGDTVTARFADVVVTGEISAVGTDYISIETPYETADLRLGYFALSVSKRAQGGKSGSPGSATLKARLAEYEQTGETVSLVLRDGRKWDASRLHVVATDHVAIGHEGEPRTYLPLAEIAAAFRSRLTR